MSSIIRLILILAVVLSGLALHLQNDQPVTLGYYLGTVELPLSLALVLALILGAALGALAGLPLILRLRGQRRGLEKQLKNSARESNNPRITPLRD